MGLSLIPSDAFAYQTFNDNRLTYGVSGQKYWLGPEAVTHHGVAIPNGVNLWNNENRVGVSYARTNSKGDSRLDFTRVGWNDPYCAVTYMFVGTSETSPFTQNWTWAKVQVREDMKDPTQCGAATHRPVVFAHEMGHAMGLAHANVASGGKALMHQNIALPSHAGVTGPTADDANGVNHLY